MPDLKEGLAKFISENLRDKKAQPTRLRKLEHTKQLLGGDLRIGGVPPRGPRRISSKRKIGDHIELSQEHLAAEFGRAHIHSAAIDDEKAFSLKSDEYMDFPTGSTRSDRRQTKTSAQRAFARTNTACMADMGACSEITFRDFLIYALEKLDKAAFSLVWVVAFLGICHKRPIIEKRKGCDHPFNDEVLVDTENGAITYNIIRRCQDPDNSVYEICGRMFLPVGKEITDGLQEIARLGSRKSCIAAAYRAARKFSGRAPGIVPTLVRLRASSMIRLAALGLTELEIGALRGRVQPALLGISAYYPRRSSHIAVRFREAYQRAVDTWCLPYALRYDFSDVPSNQDSPIFCKTSRGKALAANLLGNIGAEYERVAKSLRNLQVIDDPTDAVDALNVHELATYMFQELGLGLRPVGNVAQVSIDGRINGALTRDKASRLYDERSFSPVSEIHEALIETGRNNRHLVEEILANFGIPFVLEEPKSDLAMRFKYDKRERSIVGKRIRGSDFREFTKDIPSQVLGKEEPNWLRHVVAEHLGERLPRWQCDEFLGHKVAGREPFGPWSTVSAADLDSLLDILDALHRQLVPLELLRPINLASKTQD